jgi:transcription factor E
MIMQINLLKSLVEEMAGSSLIVDILFDKRDVNEFLIAKKMNLTINQVRNILYKLSAEGLVSFTRKKDKKKGWYIYFWTLNSEKCLLRIERELIRKMEDLKQLLRDRETKRYYTCKGCSIELTEEKALEHDFSCEECAEVYTLVDNTNALRDIKGKITKKENEIRDIKEELSLIQESKNKKKSSDAKKEEKERQKAKEKKSKERKKAKAKLTTPVKTKPKNKK